MGLVIERCDFKFNYSNLIMKQNKRWSFFCLTINVITTLLLFSGSNCAFTKTSFEKNLDFNGSNHLIKQNQVDVYSSLSYLTSKLSQKLNNIQKRNLRGFRRKTYPFILKRNFYKTKENYL